MEGNKGREEGGTTNPQLFGKLAIYTNAHAPNRATGGKKRCRVFELCLFRFCSSFLYINVYEYYVIDLEGDPNAVEPIGSFFSNQFSFFFVFFLKVEETRPAASTWQERNELLRLMECAR